MTLPFRVRFGRYARICIRPITIWQIAALRLRGYRPLYRGSGVMTKPNAAQRELERVFR